MCDSKQLCATIARRRPAFRFNISSLSAILILSLAAAPASEIFGRSRKLIDARGGAGFQTGKDEFPLELHKVLERELAGGQSHSYQIALVAGQYLSVVVDQRGIDVLVRLFAPGDHRVREVDSPNGTQGPELVEIIAEVTGSYRLEISAPQKDVSSARYTVRIEALRDPNDRDKRRCAALDSIAEAEELMAKRTPDARRSAILKYEAALTSWRHLGDAKGEMGTLGRIGEVYDFLGEHQKALLSYEQALPLAHTLTSAEQAFVLDKIGSEHLWLGQHQAAQEYYSQALPLWRAAGNRAGEATTLNNIGVSHWEMSETEEALEQFKQSFEISRSIGDLRAQGGTLNDIGAAYTNLGQRQEAIDNYLRALDLRRQMTDPEGEIETLINIGVLYLDLGETQQAVDYLETALPLAHRLGRSRDEARALRQMGNVYSQRRERAKALQCYEQALTLDRASSNLRGEGYSLNAIGLLYDRNGDRREALNFYTQALARRRDVNDRAGEAITLNNIGKVWQELGERQKALDSYSQGLEKSRAIARRDTESLVLTNLAGLQMETGNLTQARSTMESALSLVESMRARVVNQELRSSYLALVQDRFELYIDLLMRLNRERPSDSLDILAFEASERSRARSLLDLLNEAHTDITQGVDARLLARERVLQRQLDARAAARTAVLSSNHSDDQAAVAERAVRAAAVDYEQIKTQIRTASPRYAALTQPQPASASEIRSLLDDNTILLEYSLGPTQSYLWAVTPLSIKSYQLPSRAVIESMARRVYELLVARQPETGRTQAAQRAAEAKADAEYLKVAADLSRILLGQVEGELGTRRLVIVASGTLQYLPFGVLPAPDGRAAQAPTKDQAPRDTSSYTPLMVDHEMVSLPSASVLALLRKEEMVRERGPRTVAVLADPVFDKSDPRVRLKGPASTGGETLPRPPAKRAASSELERAVMDVAPGTGTRKLARLPFTRQEANAIVAAVASRSSLIALDFQASRATVSAGQLGQHRIVHFATHGLIDAERPELSGLVLSLVDETGLEQEGFLRLHEIYNLRLSADLVVLSACQTALGKDVKGEGLVGLTRGFMYAGAPRIAASLWKVDDVATAELMKRFYNAMFKEGMRPAAALRAAQIEMWKRQQWRPPYYWGAFILQGDWR